MRPDFLGLDRKGGPVKTHPVVLLPKNFYTHPEASKLLSGLLRTVVTRGRHTTDFKGLS